MGGYAKTPLCEAILMDDPRESYEMVKALLEAGEDPNLPDEWREYIRPMYLAWAKKSTEESKGSSNFL